MKLRSRLVAVGCMVACIGLFVGHYVATPVYGAELGNRAVVLSDSTPSITSAYQLSFTLSTAATLGSMAIQFCSNGPFTYTPCTLPVGIDASGATLTDQAGQAGFSMASAGVNSVNLTRTPGLAPTGSVHYRLDGIKNPSNAGSYYVRVQTFASNNATGPENDEGGFIFAINNRLSITATVPPFLTFCTAVTIPNRSCANTSGDSINFGELSSTRTRSGTSQMLVATNAAEGFNISMQGTTLSSGNNSINSLASGDVSRAGTAQFGLNLRANSNPSGGKDPTGPGVSQPHSNYNQPNTYRFVNGDTVVLDAVPDDVRVFTSSYIVNVPNLQSPGVYVSTITYVCLANF